MPDALAGDADADNASEHWEVAAVLAGGDSPKAGGFKFEARIINYPGGVPGDVGLFFSWPKDSLEA